MSHDESDDLEYNPFAEEDNSSRLTLTQADHYSSAFFPKRPNSRPTLRLRRSASTDPHYNSDEEERRKHVRTRTEIQISPKSAGLHPLKSALAGINGPIFSDLGITRPYLSRMVSESNPTEETSVDTSAIAKGLPSPEDEKDVIVHHVTSKDSLAGVSLKYGILLANLRRANQLWTSDTIHRRDVLYIPIDQASRASEYIPNSPPDKSFNETVESIETNATSPSSPERQTTEHGPPSSSVAIRRIPTKQLTYFPPSTNKLVEPKLDEQSAISTPHHYPADVSRSSPLYNRYSSSPANNSLTSILTALPITASTRDEIITRLSLDSVSSSFSDRSRAASDEDGHELDEVKRPKQLQLYSDDDMEDSDELLMPTPKASHRLAPKLPSIRNEHSASSISSSLPKPSHSHSSVSPPRFYVSQSNEINVRTSQLEPSPAMRLPNFRSSTVSQSSGKRLQENIGLERTNSQQLPGARANRLVTGNSDVKLDTIKINGPM